MCRRNLALNLIFFFFFFSWRECDYKFSERFFLLIKYFIKINLWSISSNYRIPRWGTFTVLPPFEISQNFGIPLKFIITLVIKNWLEELQQNQVLTKRMIFNQKCGCSNLNLLVTSSLQNSIQCYVMAVFNVNRDLKIHY